MWIIRIIRSGKSQRKKKMAFLSELEKVKTNKYNWVEKPVGNWMRMSGRKMEIERLGPSPRLICVGIMRKLREENNIDEGSWT